MIFLLLCTAKIEKIIGISKKSSGIIFSRNEFVINFGQFVKKRQPTVPSSDTLSSFWASTANSMGSFCSTSLA